MKKYNELTNELTLVDFYANWCGPCKMLTPILEQFSDKTKDEVEVYKLDVDECPEICGQYNITSIPTLLFFKNGKLVNFPSKPSEQQEVYKIMIQWFEKNKKYTEPEINDIIKSKIECRDHATLRRDLVDNKLLNRSGDGKEYWV